MKPMKIITTHIDPDFDAFASAVAAQRLYPDHKIIIEGKLSTTLDKYLKGRKIFYPYYTFNELKINDVSSMVIVDTVDSRQLGKLKKFVGKAEKVIYIDHHIPAVKENAVYLWEECGACITFLMKLLQKGKVKLLPGDASLFATALYRETDRFMNENTKSEDLKAAAWLLSSGASLKEIGAHSGQLIDQKQIELSSKFIESLKILNTNGTSIALVEEYSEDFPVGFRLIVEGLWNFLSQDNLLVLLHVRERTFFFGRSRYGEVNFQDLLKGEAGSFSSFNYIEDTDPDNARKRLIAAINSNVIDSARARDIMSSPVRTVLSEMELSDVLKIMEHTGHSGLPVIDENKLVGIVTKKDVETAIKHGFNKRPVKNIMSKNLVTSRISDSIDELKRKMVENDIGRILIIDHGILQGIVTRTDVMRSPYELSRKGKQSEKYNEIELIKADVAKLMEERIDNRVLTILRFIGAVGTETGMSVYIVGGFVRDLFMNRSNYDIDIVVEGNASIFARSFARYFGARVVDHKEFLTSSVYMRDEMKIDIATARTEYYDVPGALPNVEMSNIKKDLYRRDFSINAMAIKLNQEEFGTLIDFFGCRKDIVNENIRVLHNLSFIEDSTRILRAIRFEQRYNFKIEGHTLELLKLSTREGYIEKITGGRIREELVKFFEEPMPLRGLERMTELGVLEHIFGPEVYEKSIQNAVANFLNRFKEKEQLGYGYDRLYLVSMILLSRADNTLLSNFIKKYGFSKKFSDYIIESKRVLRDFLKAGTKKFSDFYRFLGKPRVQIYLFVDAFLDDRDSDLLLEYMRLLESMKLGVNGKFLVERYNLSTGPIIQKLLDEIICARLDGLDPMKEVDFIDEFVKKENMKNEDLK